MSDITIEFDGFNTTDTSNPTYDFNPFNPFTPRKPNYVNPETKAPLVVGSVVAVSVLAFVFVALRLVSRIWVLKMMKLEDYLIVVALGMGCAMGAAMIKLAEYGLGRRFLDTPPEWFPYQKKWGFMAGALYNPTLMVIKTSILIFYLRLSPHSRFRYTCYAVLGVVLAGGTSFTLTAFLGCTPIASSWDFTVAPVKCLNLFLLAFYAAIFNVVTDIIILLLPIFFIYKTRLPRPQKLAISVVFGLGTFVCVMSLARCVLVYKANENIMDYNFGYGTHSAIWSIVEPQVGIVCACLPSIRSLLARIFPRTFPRPDSVTTDSLGKSAFHLPSAFRFSSMARGIGGSRSDAYGISLDDSMVSAREGSITGKNRIFRGGEGFEGDHRVIVERPMRRGSEFVERNADNWIQKTVDFTVSVHRKDSY